MLSIKRIKNTDNKTPDALIFPHLLSTVFIDLIISLKIFLYLGFISTTGFIFIVQLLFSFYNYLIFVFLLKF